ncbi:hypothetical protein ABW21_db0205129 [Orbilia brochopaga]|nr:hypothetical protein ABW21_db0205129 [Drechslerella brochopaga]
MDDNPAGEGIRGNDGDGEDSPTGEGTSGNDRGQDANQGNGGGQNAGGAASALPTGQAANLSAGLQAGPWNPQKPPRGPYHQEDGEMDTTDQTSHVELANLVLKKATLCARRMLVDLEEH